MSSANFATLILSLFSRPFSRTLYKFMINLWKLKCRFGDPVGQESMIYTSHVTRKPVFRVCGQGKLKPACTANETSWGLEISAIASRGIILSRQQTTKGLIRQRGCAGWSAPLLFTYDINRFCHDVAHAVMILSFGQIGLGKECRLRSDCT